MITTPKLISSLVVATAVSLASFSSGASDLVVGDAPTKNVKAWDLDLANITDVQKLYVRVQDAASDVCRAEARRHWNTTKRYAGAGWTATCIADAVDGTVRDVGNPLLAALHSRESVARND